jgi:hypothetical protein
MRKRTGEGRQKWQRNAAPRPFPCHPIPLPEPAFWDVAHFRPGSAQLRAGRSKQFNWWLEQAMTHDRLRSEAKWSEAIAVGDRAYVEANERQIRGREELPIEEQGGSWTLRECY